MMTLKKTLTHLNGADFLILEPLFHLPRRLSKIRRPQSPLSRDHQGRLRGLGSLILQGDTSAW